MTDPQDDVETPRRRRQLRAVETLGDVRPEVADRHLTLGAPVQRSGQWGEELANLLRSEIRLAVRRGVISAGESEQLMARLVLVIDQALSTG
jgi:hypothetical protein